MIADDGVSGVATKLIDRPQGKRLFDMLRSGDVLLVRWVDRLGRNYEDVTHTIRHFMQQGVVIETVINRMRFDGATTDPIQRAVRDALIAFMAATAEAQATATKDAQEAGIKAAQKSPEKYRGRRPSYTREQFHAVKNELQFNPNITAVARQHDLSRQTILRIRDHEIEAEAALTRWGM